MDYPTIPSELVWTVLEAVKTAKNEPIENAPYPDEFKTLLRLAVGADKARRTTVGDLETEIASVYAELDEFRSRLTEGTKEEVWAAYLKLKATLIQKLIELQERTHNIKTVKAFQERVLKGIDDVLTPDQRTRFIKFMES